jgi:hypothetical protein
LSVRNRWIRTRRFSPKASCLVLGLGELCAFAVNLGRLSIARFEQNSGTVPEFFHLRLVSLDFPDEFVDASFESSMARKISIAGKKGRTAERETRFYMVGPISLMADH